MRKLLQKYLKNEKGLTLIELLVVVVILGIIAAIAVISIGGILDNSKKDAFVSDAKQMVNAAKMWVSTNTDDTELNGTTKKKTLSLQYMKDQNLLDDFEDPDTKKDFAKPEESSVAIVKNGAKYTYTVTLKGAQRSITSAGSTSLTRDAVKDN